MKAIEFALKNRTLTWAAFFITMLLGVLSLSSISRREDPDLDGRFFQVIVKMPGADAGQVEQLVSQRVERAILELDDTNVVESTSRPGFAVFRIEPSDRSRDLGAFTRKLRARMDDLRKDLPSQVTQVDINDRFSDTVAMIVSVRRPGASPKELEDYALKVRARLRTLDQIDSADLVGNPEPRVMVELDSNRLSRYGVSPDQIRSALIAKNVLPESGGGIDSGQRRLEVATTGQAGSLEEIASIPLTASDGSNLLLRDLAEVTWKLQDPPASKVKVNGDRAVAIALTMRKGLDLTKFGADVRGLLAKVATELPKDVKIDVVNDLPSSVRDRIGEFTENLVTGVVLIAVVTFLFMGIRSATIVTLSLPITVVGIFLAMKLLGRDIQQISVAALIISLGLVVDNSIVVIDNIERKLAEGLSRLLAVQQGTTELFGPLVVSNLTTVGAFAPLAFISGGKGDFIKDLGLITSVSTLVSLIFNVTVIPLIAGRILKVESGHELGRIQRVVTRVFGYLGDRLGGLSAIAIGRAALTSVIAIVALVVSAQRIPSLGQQFFPEALRNQFAVDLILPEGSTIEATEASTKQVEQFLGRESAVASYASYIGQGSPRFYYNFTPEAPAASIAQVVVNTNTIESTSDLVSRLQKFANASIPGATVIVRKLTQGPPSIAPIAIRLKGDRIEDLRAAAQMVYAAAKETPGAGAFYDDYRESKVTSKFTVDELRANDAGLTPGQVLQFANLAYAGQEVTRFREGDREIPVELRLASRETQSQARPEDIYLPSRTGNAVRLGDVAQESLIGQVGRIVRRNGSRTLTVYGFSDGSVPHLAVFEPLWQRVKALQLPGGVVAEYAGDKLEREVSFAEIGSVSALGVLFNVLCVAWLFPNWRIVSAISFATPLSLIGGIFGLVVAHQPFGFMALLGIVSLGGVVTNHTIMIFQYALAGVEQGKTMRQALVQAGRDRFRPILLTVLLSIMGLIPQALNGGSLWPPLAYALIFGLLVSLLLTIVVIPAFFSLLSGKEKVQVH